MVKEYVGAEVTLLSRVLQADSYAFPFGGRNPMWVGWWLKVLGKTVHMNDLLYFSLNDFVGLVENNRDQVKPEVVRWLTDVEHGMPTLSNPELLELVSQEDALFFDRMRERVEQLPPYQRGIAMRAGYNTLRYAGQISSDPKYRDLKMPLAKVFNRDVVELNKRVTMNGKGVAHRKEASVFVQNPVAQVLFMQFPGMGGIPTSYATGFRPRGPMGREIWARGPSKNWLPELKQTVKGRFGDTLTPEGYYMVMKEFLAKADKYPCWVFNLPEEQYAETAKVISQFRKLKSAHRMDSRGQSGGYMSYFLIAEK